MNELQNAINHIISTDKIYKVIISNPINKSTDFKKIVIESKSSSYHISKYTEKQVFHENLTYDELSTRIFELTNGNYKQLNAWSEEA